jgi:hypothetical protein
VAWSDWRIKESENVEKVERNESTRNTQAKIHSPCRARAVFIHHKFIYIFSFSYIEFSAIWTKCQLSKIQYSFKIYPESESPRTEMQHNMQGKGQTAGQRVKIF